MKQVFAVIGGSILALALVAALVIGGQRFGWWLKTYDVNKGAQVYQQGYGAQTAYAQQLDNLISQWNGIEVQITSPQTPTTEVPALTSQAASVATQACSIFGQITSPTNHAQDFAEANCS